jgi:hypothetical protein
MIKKIIMLLVTSIFLMPVVYAADNVTFVWGMDL